MKMVDVNTGTAFLCNPDGFFNAIQFLFSGGIAKVQKERPVVLFCKPGIFYGLFKWCGLVFDTMRHTQRTFFKTFFNFLFTLRKQCRSIPDLHHSS